MNKLLITLTALAAAVPAMTAQLVSASPDPLFQNSENVVITYRPNDANSNQTLANLPASTPIYAHVGVITTASANNTDWKHASTWKDNSDKYKLTYVGPNEYTLTIGDINKYYGITGSEKVTKLAFVFRDATASKEGKTKDGGDIIVELAQEGMTFTNDPSGTRYIVGDKVKFTIVNYPAATLTLSITDGPVLATKENATLLEYEHTFTEEGKFQFVASNGTKTTKKTFTVVDAGPAEDYPGGVPKMGAVENADGSVTFCIAAPEISTMRLIGSWDGDSYDEDLPSQLMKHCTYNGVRYFWLTVPGLDPAKQHFYYYLADDNKRVADPYSKLVLVKGLDNSNNLADIWAEGEMALPTYPAASKSSRMTVYQRDMNKYDWAPFTIPNHEGLFIYEMLFRDFTGTEGKANGNGTVRLAMEKIPYLKAMGVNAVELMPIMEFNGNRSWGYNTDYYFAPDKAYGSPTDYKDFINECHKNGIAVILDIVFNQCQDHPWYVMYNSTSNPFINASAPHDYSVLNDWKQENPLVEQHFIDCIKYWMTEYNVDGYRFDLVKGLGDNSSYGGGTEAYNQSRVDRMIRFHDAIRSVKPNGIHINEFLGGATEEKAYAADGQLVWAKYSDNCYNYVKGSGNGALHYLSGIGTGVPQLNRITYAESHDEQRVAYNANASGTSGVKGNMATVAKRCAQLAVQHILSPGPKMIWQFEELVANQNTKNGSGNDTGNKTVIWSNLENENYKAVYDTYCAMGKIRSLSPQLFESTDTYSNVNMSSSSFANPRTMVLTKGEREVVAFINPAVSGDAKTVSAAAKVMTPTNAELVFATPGTNPTLSVSGTDLQVTVAPNSFAVYATKEALGIDDVTFGGEGADRVVYGVDGAIEIVGDYSKAEVFNLQGVAMGRLDNLARGIYLVRVDGNTFKVAVR